MTQLSLLTNGVLRMKEVEQICSMSRHTIKRRIADGSFPKAISLGGRCVGWRVEEIELWIRNPEAFAHHNHNAAKGGAS